MRSFPEQLIASQLQGCHLQTNDEKYSNLSFTLFRISPQLNTIIFETLQKPDVFR